MILITMAGQSRRFFDAGYTLPKYALDLGGATMFERAVRSFENYFLTDNFLFVIRPDINAKLFVDEYATKLGIKKFSTYMLQCDTRGQAETAYEAVKNIEIDQPILIFNIDTIRHEYKYPEFIEDCDGYLEVFIGDGSHWSFVQPGADQLVVRTAEKNRISNLCSDGLYYFKSMFKFRAVFEEALRFDIREKGEFYVAPLFNSLIRNGAIVKYDLIDMNKIDFAGTPEEYEILLKTGY